MIFPIDFKLLWIARGGIFAIFAACEKRQEAKKSSFSTYRWAGRRRNWKENKNKAASPSSWESGEDTHGKKNLLILISDFPLPAEKSGKRKST